MFVNSANAMVLAGNTFIKLFKREKDNFSQGETKTKRYGMSVEVKGKRSYGT